MFVGTVRWDCSLGLFVGTAVALGRIRKIQNEKRSAGAAGGGRGPRREAGCAMRAVAENRPYPGRSRVDRTDLRTAPGPRPPGRALPWNSKITGSEFQANGQPELPWLQQQHPRIP